MSRTLAVCVGLTLVGMMLVPTVLSPKAGFASSSTSTTANHFGKGASQLGQSGQMGTHASTGGGFFNPHTAKGGHPPTDTLLNLGRPGRAGIGEVGTQICGEKLKPGQLADVLNGGSCP